MKLTQKLKDHLWWMIISVDYDYSRISIADHELTNDTLTLWLEDKQDFKNSLHECLQLEVTARQFAKTIKAENLNSYEANQTHPEKQFVYKIRVQISEPLQWYLKDATTAEQQWAREAMLRSVLTYLIETESVEEDDLFY